MTREEIIKSMSLQDAIQVFKDTNCYGTMDIAKSVILKALEQEPKTGHWIEVTNGRGGHECDACHDYAPSFQNGNEYLSAFCPNCGAKMESEE